MLDFKSSHFYLNFSKIKIYANVHKSSSFIQFYQNEKNMTQIIVT